MLKVLFGSRNRGLGRYSYEGFPSDRPVWWVDIDDHVLTNEVKLGAKAQQTVTPGSLSELQRSLRQVIRLCVKAYLEQQGFYIIHEDPYDD